MSATHLELPYSIDAKNPFLLDKRSGPWASKAAANAGIPEAVRVQGLVVIVQDAIVGYYYKDGIEDVDLVPINTDEYAVWSQISGNLADQTDLQAALDAKEDDIAPGTAGQYWRGDKTWQTLDTSNVPENGAVYFTQARARQSIDVTATGNSGAATYNNTTGIINIPQYTLAGLGGEPAIALGTSLQYWRGDKSWQTLNTDAVPEATAKYYTDARVLAYGNTQWPRLDGSYTNPSWIVSLPWSKVTNTPTTIAGYGITDAFTESESDARYVKKAGDIMTGNLLIAAPASIDSTLVPGEDILNLGTANASVINIGWGGATINIQGSVMWQDVDNLAVTDKLIRLNKGGATASGVSSGFEIEENAVITGWFATDSTRTGWDFKAPASQQLTLGLDLLTASRTIKMPNLTGTLLIDAATYSDPAWLATLAWSKITGTPTTLVGYGITNAYTKTEVDSLLTNYVPIGRQLTINGVAQDLSANRSWTVGDVRTDSSYSNPTWLTALAWSKITGTPTTLGGYGISDAYTTTQINAFFFGSTPITGYNKSNWDTAFGWGNHASAGYITPSYQYYIGTTLNALNRASGAQTLTGVSIDGNAATATTFSTTRSNYKGVTDGAVAGQLMWKYYGNGHTIFDASNGTAPDGTSVSNTNAAVPWASTYPTLMGWNGSTSYGVGVDRARVADDSSLLQGYSAVVAASANTIALRDGNGYLRAVYFYDDNISVVGSGITSIYGGTGDRYLYKFNASAVQTFLGLGSMAYASTSSYVPYTGATANLQMGARDVSANSFLSNGYYAADGSALMIVDGTYVRLYRRNGNIGIYLGGSDAGNYYDNGTHYFRGSGGSGTYATIQDGMSTFYGEAQAYNIDNTNRTTYRDILYITAQNGALPYDGHGGGILFRGSTYQNSGVNVAYARIGTTITSNSVSTTGSTMFFDIATNSSGALSRALDIYTNTNARFYGVLSVATGYAGYTLNVGGSVYTDGDYRMAVGQQITNQSGNARITFGTSALGFYGAATFNNSVTLSAGNTLTLVTGDLWIQSEGYGILSANANRAIAIYNSAVTVNYALNVGGRILGLRNSASSLYTEMQIEAYSSNASDVGYSFHRGGYSAVSLYHGSTYGGLALSSGNFTLVSGSFNGLGASLSYQTTINTTTPGTTTYALHFSGQSTADYATGITWNGGSTGAQAGIYVQGSGSYGTRMYIATTDNYTTGSKTAISIDQSGLVNFVRTRPTALGNIMLDAGNFTSYALSIGGGTISSTADQPLTINKISGSFWSYIGFTYAGTRKGYFGIDGSGNPVIGADTGLMQFNGAANFSTSITAAALNINNNSGGITLTRTAVTNYIGLYYKTDVNFRWFVGMRENLGQDNYVIYNEIGGHDAFRIAIATSDITTQGAMSSNYFDAQYGGAYGAYNGTFDWDLLQLGNNGANRIVAGDIVGGGWLDFYVNNTNRARGTSPNGNLAYRINADGYNQFFYRVSAPNFHDSYGTYNVNLGSGGSEGRGLVAGYSGGSYAGIGYNIRHINSSATWTAPGGDAVSYILFNAGFTFMYAAGGAAGRDISGTLTNVLRVGSGGSIENRGEIYPGLNNGSPGSQTSYFLYGHSTTGGLRTNGSFTVDGYAEANRMYVSNYFRVNGDNGIYWESHANRIISTSSAYVQVWSNFGILFNNTAGTNRGYFYHDDSNIGFLNNSGNWAVRGNQGGANSGGTLYGEWLGNASITVNNHLYINQNFGSSLIGAYNSTKFQGIYAMGPAYTQALDGSSLSSLYGLAWAHPNAGGQAAYLNSHGLMVVVNGLCYAAISENLWMRGNIVSNTYMYATSYVAANTYLSANAGQMYIGADSTYGGYNTISFDGGTGNGSANRIFARNSSPDGLYMAVRSLAVRIGGSTSDAFTINSSQNATLSGTFTSTGDHYIQNGSPTIYMLDTDNRSAMIHVNSNLFYVLRGSGTNSSSWSQTRGAWPMELNLENNNATFGGSLTTNGPIYPGYVNGADGIQSSFYLYAQNSVSAIRTNGSFYVDSDIYLGTRGTWLSSWLNQAVLTTSNVTFNTVVGTNGGSDSDITLKNIISRGYGGQARSEVALFTWKNPEYGVRPKYGYIAQEVQEWLPEAVFIPEGKTTLAVDYAMVHTVLIDDNTRRIKELEREVAELKSQLNRN